MHVHTLTRWKHSHDFATINDKGEQRTRYVLLLTAVTMVAEIVAGSLYGSMALLADGWHMGTHVAAFMITIFAYRYARKYENNPAFTFGTGKVTVLGGFSSAVALAVVALVMVAESLERIMNPETIHFNQAIALLAIFALLAGKYIGWNWLDPVMGIVGAAVITRWAYGLLRETGPILLDASIEKDYQQAIQEAIENDADNRVSDIHVWKVGANHYAAIISLVTHFPNTMDHYKTLLRDFHKLSHITIEVQECRETPCIPLGKNTAF